jgi:hypothetical protein
MSHFYTSSKNPQFLEDVTTPHQALKNGRAYPSVTTVLGIVKDDFLDSIYMPRKLVELAREHPTQHYSVLREWCYGFREHPFTGEMISSSEFGTSVHKRIEDWLMDGEGEASAYDDWAKPFIDWVNEEGVQVVDCEYIISDSRFKIAGSIDFIGLDKDEKVFLADYKCRSCKDGKGKFYPKDCKQLAIESVMLARKLKLDYFPKVRSVCIDTNTAEHYHYEWSDDEFNHYFECAKLSAKTYWTERMTAKPKKTRKKKNG